jgi:hypothetical protein
MEGADVYQIAKNCRTSVEMIEKYHAAHIRNTLDANPDSFRKIVAPPKAPPPDLWARVWRFLFGPRQ